MRTVSTPLTATLTAATIAVTGFAAASLLTSYAGAAAGPTVTVANMAFSPASVTVAQGGSVTWEFKDTVAHTSTSNQKLWNTGQHTSGDSASVRFPSAGTFGYHCAVHPMMTGKVKVPLIATGTSAKGWTIRWLTGTNPSGRTYDVQVKHAGDDHWKALRTNTTAATLHFDPSRTGTWLVRARTGKGTGSNTGWSPTRSVSIT